VVYVIRDDAAREIEVQLGAKIGDLVEVVKGVTAGEKVVMKPSGQLRDGSRVAPLVAK
jgi:hypothetical protein